MLFWQHMSITMLLNAKQNNFFKQSGGPMANAEGKKLAFSAFLKSVQNLETNHDPKA